MDPPTAKFAHALPFTLFSVSPQLAALHNVRTGNQSPHSCPRCGSELAASTRLVRTRSSTCSGPSRAVSVSCSACGARSSISVENGNASSFPSRKRKSPASPSVVSLSSATPPPVVQPPAPSPSTLVKPSKGRPATSPQHTSKSKTKPGLQEMLKRNREKEKKRAKTEESKTTGLSAFLSTLWP
ncbi:unnamed protein product [Cyclocybe aegerita]|uniref:Uncharacterized protein n=1 Tax=Cyclocybe aegerita TaxID=1973307 RepID=A0A8S0XLH3_CYCAE|nr:unnamed protein product [Cyclocybe aegerita]